VNPSASVKFSKIHLMNFTRNMVFSDIFQSFSVFLGIILIDRIKIREYH
jgi:hypothetical protein